MADFPGEILSVVFGEATLQGEILSVVFGEDTLQGECIDAAPIPAFGLLAPFGVTIEAAAALERLLVLPSESRAGALGLFALPIDFQDTEALLVPPFTVPISTLQGIASPKDLPIEFTGTTPLSLDMFVPIEAFGGSEFIQSVPVESLVGVTITKGLPTEFQLGVAGAKQLPVEFTGTLAIDGKFVLPIEALGGFADIESLPIEADGLTVIQASQQLPVESLARLVRDFVLPVEAVSEFGVILHTWQVLTPLADTFLHTWLVLPVAVLTPIDHTWLIQNIFGNTIDHTWRVLPDKIVTLFGADIQCPFGTADKP